MSRNYKTNTFIKPNHLRKLFLLFFFFSMAYLGANAQQLAFPGAEGGGRFAVGGRYGSLYEVTNLNDSGPGSLRDGLSQPNRTIVFKVSGVINLQSKLSIAKDSITIAGQTAPGDGICITGYTVNIRASHIIMRHIRCRLSDVNNVEDDAMNSFSGDYHDIIIDHCSLSWSVDETGSFYGIRNFTLQWCILSESLYNSAHGKGKHGYGGIWGGENASFHHNLLAHHTSRNPRFGGSRFTGEPDKEVVDFRNNVIYNWAGNSAYGGEGGNYNMVNNYYKAGPATSGNLSTSSSSNKRNRILQYTSYYYGEDAAIYPDTVWGGKFYIDGNFVAGYPDVTADNWTNGVQKDGYTKAAELIAAARLNDPVATPPVTTQTAEEAYVSVLHNVGATLPKRDTIDKRIVHEAETGTATYEGSTYAAVTSTGVSHPSGIIDSQTDVGGVPAYNSVTPPADSDKDGMPDDWETDNGLDPQNAADGAAIGADGYSNLETYLNSIESSETKISVTANLTVFYQTVGSASDVQSYTISAADLTNDIVITPPAGFEVSADGGSTWYTNASPLTIAHSGGVVVPTAISVRMNAGASGSYSGNIVNESTDAGSFEVAVAGMASSTISQPTGTAIVVAKDGSGDYTTVQSAIDAAPTEQTSPYIIFIKNGVYKEKINIPSNKPFLQLVGESVANTILTYDDYSGKEMPGGGTYGTSNSASVMVSANDFTAINITFENTTGDAPQALAIHVNADRATFKNCRFLGGQDTILTNGAGKRQYYKNCYIDGVVDFIFGPAIAVFDSCIVYARSRKDGLSGSYITAANTPNGQTYGYVFRNCTLPSNTGVTKYVLGRPWQNATGSDPRSYPKVVFLNTTMGHDIVKPEGWSVWNDGTVTSEIFYAEYKSKKFNGDLIDVSQRVSWSFQLSDAEAAQYTTANIFGDWDPCSASGICHPWTPSLAISNFKGEKGDVNADISWNISWPVSGVKYELFRSSDSISFSKINEQIAATDTTVNFSYTESIPQAGVTHYYFVIASKDGYEPHKTTTVAISSTPTITTTGSLKSFLQGLGQPSAVQAYSISGENLTEAITITPPVGFEVSADGGATWHNNASPLTVPVTGGIVASTSISVRLNASAAGSYSGNITHSSAGAQSVALSAMGEVQSDPLPVSNVLLYWPFSVSSEDDVSARSEGVEAEETTLHNFFLSNGTTVSAIPAYSTTYGQGFGPGTNGEALWTTANGGPGGNLNRAFYQQFVVISSAGYTVRVDSIVLNASYYNTSSNTKLAIVYSKSGFTTNDSTEVTGGVGADGNPFLSTANGGFETPVVLTKENEGTNLNYRFALAETQGVTIANGERLTIRLYFSCGSTSEGRYAKLKDVYIKGFVESNPGITVEGSLGEFSQNLGTPSDIQTYTVSASGLEDFLTIVPPANFEISLHGADTWKNNSSSLVFIANEGKVEPISIDVRLNTDAPGTYSGDIAHTSTGATTVNLAVMGSASGVTGLGEDLAERDFKVWPNPATTRLNIQLSKDFIGGKRQLVSVYNNLGVKVAAFTLNEGTGQSVFNVDNLPEGVYHIEAISKNDRKLVRFIKLQ